MKLITCLVPSLALALAACTAASEPPTPAALIRSCESSPQSMDGNAFIVTTGTEIGAASSGLPPPTLDSQEALLGALAWVWQNNNDAADLLSAGITEDVNTRYAWSAEYLDIITATIAQHPSWGSQALVDRARTEIGRVRDGFSRYRSLTGRLTPVNFTVRNCEFDDHDPYLDNPEEVLLDGDENDADVITGPGEDLYATNLEGDIDFGDYGSSSIDGTGGCDANCGADGWDYFDIDGGFGGETFGVSDLGIDLALGSGCAGGVVANPTGKVIYCQF